MPTNLHFTLTIRHGDSEYAERKERRAHELAMLNEKEEALNSMNKESENGIEQSKGALVNFRNESQAASNELRRIQQKLGTIYD